MEAELKQVIDDLGTGFEALQARMADIDATTKKFGDIDVVDRTEVDKIAADVIALKTASEAIERKLNTATLPGAAGDQTDPEKAEEKKQFLGAMRTKGGWNKFESKAVDADFGSDTTSGGVAIPEMIASQILKKVIDISPMRGLVTVTPVSNPQYQRLVDVRGLASGWAGETDVRGETGTPSIEKVTFTHGELFAVPKASQWSLNDLMFNVENWLITNVADEFAYQEGLAIISGDGTDKPTGFLNGTPVNTDDDGVSPARAFGTLQYLPTGMAGAFNNDVLTSPAGSPLAVFMDCHAKLKTRYHGNARWLMNRNTFATLLQMRDADGRPLIHWDASGAVPMNILGYPISIIDGMPDIGSNTFPVAFGDFMAAYELIDIVGMSMIRDDVTVKGSVLFYVSRRLGGKLVNDDAIKLIKAALT